jgi:hypothetical protein
MLPFGLSDILAIIKGVLQFPGTILEFVKLLQKTPQEKHQDLLKRMAEEAKKFEDTGRPTW